MAVKKEAWRIIMSDARIEGLECLFSDPGRKLVNIKFFRRSDVAISPARFKKELCDSIKRRKAKHALLSKSPPSCKNEPVDLREFVADI